MKYFWIDILFVAFMLFGMPWVIFGLMSRPQEQLPEATSQVTYATEPGEVSVWMEDHAVSMPLSEYLTGVLLREVPASFHMEAKMAQAVVARTYTLRTAASKDKHPEQSICTDSTCCQAYRSPQDYIAAGGTQKAVNEARQAVSETGGMVVTYRGELIDATYFSCSGGQTEDAIAVWGNDVPYLQSVESPGEEDATYFTDEISFTAQQFQEALGVKLTGKPEAWIEEITYTRGGGVETALIGGKEYSGTALRSALGLRSTAFTVEITDQTLTFVTKGFGHRVGMSQYGADAMAENGSTWQDILQHYYADIEIIKQDAP